jgi:hypothetical protein
MISANDDLGAPGILPERNRISQARKRGSPGFTGPLLPVTMAATAT